LAAWPLNIYEPSRSPARRGEKREAGAGARERERGREREGRRESDGKGRAFGRVARRGRRMSPASEGAKNEISASVERNRLRSLSSRGITIFALSTSSKMRLYSDGRYNCPRSTAVRHRESAFSPDRINSLRASKLPEFVIRCTLNASSRTGFLSYPSSFLFLSSFPSLKLRFERHGR